MTLFGIYIGLSLLLSMSYAYIISSILQIWRELPIWELPADFQPNTSVSVIIPARNEAAGITACLESIVQQNYPKELLEIIVIDDHSTDETAALVANLQRSYPQLQILKLSHFLSSGKINSYKKKALEVGIAQARGELIVTTDADCLAPPNWLRLLVSLYEKKNAKLIAAPVNFHQEKNLLERFQSLDFAGTMLITGAGIHARTMRLSNGANMAYPKQIFTELAGFEGVDQFASGDDMLFAQKVAAKYPDEIFFLKNAAATVLTQAKPDWQSFLQQRLRWATKSTTYKDWRITWVLVMVFFYCCNIILSLLLLPLFGIAFCWIFLIQWGLKSFFDYQLLNTACRFFHRKELMQSFLPAQMLHLAYIVVIGFLGNVVKKYEWKGRKVQ